VPHDRHGQASSSRGLARRAAAPTRATRTRQRPLPTLSNQARARVDQPRRSRRPTWWPWRALWLDGVARCVWCHIGNQGTQPCCHSAAPPGIRARRRPSFFRRYLYVGEHMRARSHVNRAALTTWRSELAPNGFSRTVLRDDRQAGREGQAPAEVTRSLSGTDDKTARSMPTTRKRRGSRRLVSRTPHLTKRRTARSPGLPQPYRTRYNVTVPLGYDDDLHLERVRRVGHDVKPTR